MDAAGGLALIVDDDAALRRLLDVRLRALGCETVLAADEQDALSAVRKDAPALMLLDLQMPRMGGLDLVWALRRDGFDFPVIVITAHGSIEAVVEAMQEGAYDFLPKPFDAQHLDIVLRKALERRCLVEANCLLRDTLDARTSEILGDSRVIPEAISVARKAAATNSTVLLLGESGTGKEVFAHAIHAANPMPPLSSPASRNGDYYSQVKESKRAIIRAALVRAAGNQTKAAELLGLQRTYLVKLLRELEIREKTAVTV